MLLFIHRLYNPGTHYLSFVVRVAFPPYHRPEPNPVPCAIPQVVEAKKGVKISREERDALSSARRVRAGDILLQSELARCVDSNKLRAALSRS